MLNLDRKYTQVPFENSTLQNVILCVRLHFSAQNYSNLQNSFELSRQLEVEPSCCIWAMKILFGNQFAGLMDL